MKKIILSIVVLFFTASSYAQSPESIQKPQPSKEDCYRCRDIRLTYGINSKEFKAGNCNFELRECGYFVKTIENLTQIPPLTGIPGDIEVDDETRKFARLSECATMVRIIADATLRNDKTTQTLIDINTRTYEMNCCEDFFGPLDQILSK